MSVLFPPTVIAQTPTGRAPDARPASPYRLQAFDEDWVFTRDPEVRGDDWSYELKEIPISGDDIRLSFGAELRSALVYELNRDFNDDVANEDSFALGRILAHGEAKFGDKFRVFGTVQFSEETGRQGPKRAIDVDRADIQNLFAEARFSLNPKIEATARVGRQELQYGGGRLITARIGLNVRRTFDAGKLILDGEDWSADVFLASPVADSIGSFDDSRRQDEILFGVYTTHRGLAPSSSIDLYYLQREQDDVAFVDGSGKSERQTIGSRISGASNGWDWDWETAYQFGDVADNYIQAWTLATDTGYRFDGLPGATRVSLSTSLISGDTKRDDGTLGSFDGLYPNGAYFSQAGLIGPRNLIHIQPQMQFEFSDTVGLKLYGNAFWRYNKNDGVYAPSGRLIRDSADVDEQEIGQSVAFTLDWAPEQHASVSLEYVHFFAGKYFNQTGPSRDIDFFELELAYRF